MTEVEKEAWHSFVAVVKGFLGNTKGSNYVDIEEGMLTTSKQVHYISSHLNRFPENLENMHKEKGESFH